LPESHFTNLNTGPNTSCGPVGHATTEDAPPEPAAGAPAADDPVPHTPAIHFDVFTLFPQMFVTPLSESIIRRALENRLISIGLHNIRDYTNDRHHICDDTPYGGGGGMVMKPEPIFRAVETVLSHPAEWSLPPDDAYQNLPPWDETLAPPLPADTSVILLTPQGRRLTQTVVAELRTYSRLAFICGRYEGVDERVRTQLATDEISIGDYVLSGGELAAMVIIDAVTRLVPGALGYALGAHQDSHSPGLGGLLEGPHYTRPHTFRNETVPEQLLSGHHANIDRWRHEQALLRTLNRRPELLATLPLSPADRTFLQRHGWQP
jgi:tRNA (guanine37-N1)-methyltransferase